MGRIKIPYYTAIAGRGYWRPTRTMRTLGFQIIRCGTDGPEAWALAAEWNKRWQAIREGDAPPLVNLEQLSRDLAEAARRYPPGSVGAAFQVYLRTREWTARAFLTREKIWWPAWFRIRDMWGDVAPDTITFEMMSRWRAALEKKHSRGVAHKDIPRLADLLEDHARDEGGTDGRPVNGHSQSGASAALATMVRRRGGAACEVGMAPRLSRLGVYRCGGMGHAILAR